MVHEAVEAPAAAFALVRLARLEALGADEVERLLQLSPALLATGPAGEALRGHTLAQAGHTRAALPYFARAAAHLQDWTLTIGWSEALAAENRRGTAAGLLGRRAREWRAAGDWARAGSALLAQVELDPEADPASAVEAAALLSRAGVPPDRALDAAARRMEAQGRCREAASIRVRLASEVPGSDRAGARPDRNSPCAAEAASRRPEAPPVPSTRF